MKSKKNNLMVFKRWFGCFGCKRFKTKVSKHTPTVTTSVQNPNSPESSSSLSVSHNINQKRINRYFYKDPNPNPLQRSEASLRMKKAADEFDKYRVVKVEELPEYTMPDNPWQLATST